MVAMGSAPRAVGTSKTGTVVGTVNVVLNMFLAPILIFGWGTGHPLGVAGAAISSLVAIVVGNAWLAAYFLPRSAHLLFETATGSRDLTSGRGCWSSVCRRLRVRDHRRLPRYRVSGDTPVRRGGAGRIGDRMRIFQRASCRSSRSAFRWRPWPDRISVPGSRDRVKNTFRDAAWIAASYMAVFTVACQISPAWMAGVFSK